MRRPCAALKRRQASKRRPTGDTSDISTLTDRSHQIWGFTIALGYSRRLWAQAALDQKLGTLLRMHEAAFQEWGAVPEEILYDRMKTVWLGADERGEVVWHPVFLDFARYWGFKPRLCRPYRAQTKGKIESGVKYVRRNFVCGLLGREPACLMDFNSELREWVDTVANRRVHGTTYEQVLFRWDMDQLAMQPLNGRPPYPYSDDELRKVARDAYVSWQASRYSVPWQYVGKGGVGSRANRRGGGALWQRADRSPPARRAETPGDHRAASSRWHSAQRTNHSGGKILVHMREMAPAVESRSLAVYESLAMGGAQ